MELNSNFIVKYFRKFFNFFKILSCKNKNIMINFYVNNMYLHINTCIINYIKNIYVKIQI